MGRRRNLTKNRVETTRKFEKWWSPAPAPAPAPWDSQKQEDQLQFLRDSHYFMHGEIIAITAITIFVIFLLFLFLPCLKRTITNIPSSSSAASHETSSSETTSSDKAEKPNTCLRRLFELKSWNGKTDELQFEYGKNISTGSGIQQQPATGNSSYY